MDTALRKETAMVYPPETKLYDLKITTGEGVEEFWFDDEQDCHPLGWEGWPDIINKIKDLYRKEYKLEENAPVFEDLRVVDSYGKPCYFNKRFSIYRTDLEPVWLLQFVLANPF